MTISKLAKYEGLGVGGLPETHPPKQEKLKKNNNFERER
jgi:hypothetical protein